MPLASSASNLVTSLQVVVIIIKGKVVVLSQHQDRIRLTKRADVDPTCTDRPRIFGRYLRMQGSIGGLPTIGFPQRLENNAASKFSGAEFPSSRDGTSPHACINTGANCLPTQDNLFDNLATT